MRIVVPVSRFDSHLLPDWCEVAKFLGCGQQHDLHFVASRSVEIPAYDAAKDLGGGFASITVHVLDYDPTGGWPVAPNQFFYEAASRMSVQPSIPWQLVELDCLPIRHNSFDVIGNQYMTCGAPFFGYVGPTPWRDEGGRIVPSLWGKGDVMMSGCAVYPGNIMNRPNFTGLMQDFMKGPTSIEMPWDMHLRGAMRADGLAHTELIANHWNTGNYRVEKGQILCDGMTDHEIFQQNPSWEVRMCGGKVNVGAVMIHGCKDQSLKNLILSDQIPNYAPARRSPVATPNIGEQVEEPVAPTVVDNLQKRVDDLTKMFAQFIQMQSQAQTPAPVQPTPEKIATVAKSPEPQPVAEEVFMPTRPLTVWEKVRAKVEGARKYRVSTLAGEVGVSTIELRDLLSQNGYHVTKPGWIIKDDVPEPANA